MATNDPRLEKRLALVRENLEREFPSVPAKELNEGFSSVVSQLLADARVLEFVPVLAARYTREQFQSREASDEPQAA
jgi:hypothetical protein